VTKRLSAHGIMRVTLTPANIIACICQCCAARALHLPELMTLVADLRHELARAEAASMLPAELDASTIEAVVVDLHRRALADPRFKG